ncbi:hypothetical protein [Aureibacter tunicatorum]|uniref:Uncharacterized protein n=1 Tax=Aureibacter tunicatorum TaxID=866807 RepID=A0AAE3XT27_9BACT|nr:hypothetical protein [Aureibacter tunicatorum]MDR6241925.1 hypothetical protein [Aureibacter tunicatorum]BDD07474.1 hypothetical protein AUTU_49570 [Aureibacter tunicatorum]
MFKIKEVPTCSWSFDYENKIYNEKELSQLRDEEINSLVRNRCHFLKEILEVLNEEAILLVDKMIINDSGNEFTQVFNDSSLDFITEEINKNAIDFMKNKSCFYCELEGSTLIETEKEKNIYNGVISINYSLLRNGIELHTYSDLWSPMSLDDNYQIDLALLNNPRLERSLKKIKAIGKYSFISPDEGEYGDEELAQLGFRIITNQGDITKFIDFPKGREEEVKPFISQYAPDYPLKDNI